MALEALAIVVHRRRMSASLAAAAAALPMSSARMPSVRYPLDVLIGADSVSAAIETAAAHSEPSDIVTRRCYNSRELKSQRVARALGAEGEGTYHMTESR